MIPPIIHRIWIGPSPMPEEFRRYGDSWRHHHPEWMMHLWTETNLPTLGDAHAVSLATTLAERSDVIRYQLLREFGGVYVDTDVECLRPLDDLIAHTAAFAAWERAGENLGNAVLGSEPRHPAFEAAALQAACILTSEGSADRERVGGSIVGPEFLTAIIADREDVTFFEPETFYPYLWADETLQQERLARNAGHDPTSRAAAVAKTSESYAIHHWSSVGRVQTDPQREIERLRATLAKAENKRYHLTLALATVESSRWWKLGALIFRWKRRS